MVLLARLVERGLHALHELHGLLPVLLGRLLLALLAFETFLGALHGALQLAQTGQTRRSALQLALLGRELGL